ncbi:peptide chain release factor N(5)-glutamine methyltransferase [bacterium]|nr:peptide chain release factor N(5)-glutamine methyltransferase [candidate division CSSED10-310 bacterium]
MNETWTVRKLIAWTAQWFADHSIASPRLDAELLLASILNCSRLDLYLMPDKPVDDHERSLFKSLIRRRIQREPVAYILGNKEFWSREFIVSPAVLIPRPETETLIETALTLTPECEDFRIADLGTGSGCIAITLALETATTHVIATDLSMEALAIARQNAERLGAGERIVFLHGSWFEPLNAVAALQSFDCIVSNPPYIRTGMIESLQPEIRMYEPFNALDGGLSGIDAYEVLAAGAMRWLKPGGRIILEIGDDQANAVETFLLNASFEAIDKIRDTSGKYRVVTGRKVCRN